MDPAGFQRTLHGENVVADDEGVSTELTQTGEQVSVRATERGGVATAATAMPAR